MNILKLRFGLKQFILSWINITPVLLMLVLTACPFIRAGKSRTSTVVNLDFDTSIDSADLKRLMQESNIINCEKEAEEISPPTGQLLPSQDIQIEIAITVEEKDRIKCNGEVVKEKMPVVDSARRGVPIVVPPPVDSSLSPALLNSVNFIRIENLSSCDWATAMASGLAGERSISEIDDLLSSTEFGNPTDKASKNSTDKTAPIGIMSREQEKARKTLLARSLNHSKHSGKASTDHQPNPNAKLTRVHFPKNDKSHPGVAAPIASVEGEIQFLADVSIFNTRNNLSVVAGRNQFLIQYLGKCLEDKELRKPSDTDALGCKKADLLIEATLIVNVEELRTTRHMASSHKPTIDDCAKTDTHPLKNKSFIPHSGPAVETGHPKILQ